MCADRGGLTDSEAMALYKLDHLTAQLDMVGSTMGSRNSAQQVARSQQGQNARLRRGVWQMSPQMEEVSRQANETAAMVRRDGGEVIGTAMKVSSDVRPTTDAHPTPSYPIAQRNIPDGCITDALLH